MGRQKKNSCKDWFDSLECQMIKDTWAGAAWGEEGHIIPLLYTWKPEKKT